MCGERSAPTRRDSAGRIIYASHMNNGKFCSAGGYLVPEKILLRSE